MKLGLMAAVVALVPLVGTATAAEPIAESGMTMPAPLVAPAPDAAQTDAALGGSPFCEGDGQSGSRIQAVYGYFAGADDYTASLPLIQSLAGHVDDAYDASAARQSGSAHPRWAFDPSCSFSVLKVQLPAGAADDFDLTVQRLSDLGLLARTDRKYMVWVDGNGMEGLIANSPTEPDDVNPATQAADGGQIVATVAQVTRDNWDDRAGPYIRFGAQHELSHMLGAVNLGAPHFQDGKHCTDGYDAMCFGATTACPADQMILLDCGNDDYFAVNPQGAWLPTHWNTYDSSFLVRTDTPDSPPATTIAGGPTGTVTSRTAQFTFSSNEPGTFECRLDGAAFKACSSPKSYAGLADGSHTFEVRARDAAGNRDFSAVTRTWTVAAGGGGGSTAPDTRITKVKVKAKKRSAKVTFSGSGGSGALTFECALDGKGYADCRSPLKLQRLKPGKHVVSVRAADAKGVADETPATAKLKVPRKRK